MEVAVGGGGYGRKHKSVIKKKKKVKFEAPEGCHVRMCNKQLDI